LVDQMITRTIQQGSRQPAVNRQVAAKSPL
jgi:hypothetical protein